MRFVQTDKRSPIYPNLDDDVLAVAEPKALFIKTSSLEAYRKRVTQYLLERRIHLTIHKLCTNQPIEAGELLALENLLFEQGDAGTREQFAATYGKQPLGKLASSCALSSASTPPPCARRSAPSSTRPRSTRSRFASSTSSCGT